VRVEQGNRRVAIDHAPLRAAVREHERERVLPRRRRHLYTVGGSELGRTARRRTRGFRRAPARNRLGAATFARGQLAAHAGDTAQREWHLVGRQTEQRIRRRYGIDNHVEVRSADLLDAPPPIARFVGLFSVGVGKEEVGALDPLPVGRARAALFEVGERERRQLAHEGSACRFVWHQLGHRILAPPARPRRQDTVDRERAKVLEKLWGREWRLTSQRRYARVDEDQAGDLRSNCVGDRREQQPTAAMANENDRVGHSVRGSADDLHAFPPLRYWRGGCGKERWHKRARFAPLEFSGNWKPCARPNERAVDEDEEHGGAHSMRLPWLKLGLEPSVYAGRLLPFLTTSPYRRNGRLRRAIVAALGCRSGR
jgi:hypothetical protein